MASGFSKGLCVEADSNHSFFLVDKYQRGGRDTSIYYILEYREWESFERSDLDAPEVRLIPYELLTFNTETKTETEND